MALGLDPGRLIHVQSASETDFFWSLEEALTCSRPLAVIGIAGETSLYDFTESKRLNLRAHRQGKPLFLLRAGETAGATACASRWRIGSLPGARPPSQAGQSRRGFFLPPLGDPCWRLSLVRAQGARPQAWPVRWDHETLRFHLAAPLAARTAGDPDRAPVRRAAGS
jgi:protein ImuA